MREGKCRIAEEIFLSIRRGCGCVRVPLDAMRIFHKMKDFRKGEANSMAPGGKNKKQHASKDTDPNRQCCEDLLFLS
ncbi:hypothetical protein NC651_010379 [Populus alba x Populus x berolinensis]|nr:hypothetical protein NC651_010379 [Populus alba x Populus x berolinensis]